MKEKVLAVVFLLTLTGMTGLFAEIKLPKIEIDIDPSNPFAEEIRSLLGVFDNNLSEEELWSRVGGIDPEFQRWIGAAKDQDLTPKGLIGAFADTSIFASSGASLRGYQGYNTLALTVGAVGGFQLPISIFSLFGNEGLANAVQKLSTGIADGDIRFGLNPQLLNAQLGINTKFVKGLYIGVKGGWLNLNLNQLPVPLPIPIQMSFQTLSIGPMINYQLIRQFRLLGGLILWRGLNLGAGFVYQKTSLNFSMPLLGEDGKISFDIWEDESPLRLGKITGEISDPEIYFGFSVNTYTVPLEAVTSIRLLGFLNASVGVGADLGFGNASLKGGVDGGINMYVAPGLRQFVRVIQQGSFSASLSGENTPTFFNPKIMGSLGFSAGPAILLDIPITYYFQNNGFNVGVTLGIAL